MKALILLSNLISKRFKPFHSVQGYLDGPKQMTDGKQSGYHKWKLVQPGFMDPAGNDFGKFGYYFAKKREVAWDGTFNQPILPLADVHSKHVKGYRFL